MSKSGTGTRWEASGQIVAREESGTGTVHLAVRQETREQESVTGEVGKNRSGKEISQPFPFPYRSRTVPTTFPVPIFTARSPAVSYAWELISVSKFYSQGDGFITFLSRLMYCNHALLT